MGKRKEQILHQGVCSECSKPFYRVQLGPKDDGTMCRTCYTKYKVLKQKSPYI